MPHPNTQRHHIGAIGNRQVSEGVLRRDACGELENLLGREAGKKRSQNSWDDVEARLQILHIRSLLAVQAHELV